jgi:hypothetical protein
MAQMSNESRVIVLDQYWLLSPRHNGAAQFQSKIVAANVMPMSYKL